MLRVDALAMLQADRYWGDFCRALGAPEMAEDERYADLLSRAQHRTEVVARFDELFATRPRDEWVRTLRESPGDFIFTIVNTVAELPEDPQMLANDYVVEFEHPNHGTTKMLGLPVRLSETPGGVRLPAPEFGQHTEEVLLDVLDYDWERIGKLRESGAI